MLLALNKEDEVIGVVLPLAKIDLDDRALFLDLCEGKSIGICLQRPAGRGLCNGAIEVWTVEDAAVCWFRDWKLPANVRSGETDLDFKELEVSYRRTVVAMGYRLAA